uniref:Uncharacterized protein n=1 Tax=Arundo donax TaxID=35708 RepID=A0A0A9DMF5_ARUDO
MCKDPLQHVFWTHLNDLSLLIFLNIKEFKRCELSTVQLVRVIVIKPTHPCSCPILINTQSTFGAQSPREF